MQNVLTKSNKLLFVIGTAWLFDAMDVALLSFIMPIIGAEWKLLPTQIGYVSAVTSLGMIFGSLGCGYLADRFGRKHVMIGTLILFSAGNLLLAFTQNVNMFMLVRFITGIGLGGELPVAATMLADSFSGKKQSRMLVLADSFWAIGWILASLLSFLVMPIFGWRVTVVCTFFVSLYAFVMRRHLPDEYENTKHERSNIFHSIKEIWSGKYLQATGVLTVLWFVVMFSYYGMFLWLPSVLIAKNIPMINSFGYTLLMSLAQLPGYYLAAWLMGKISRKNILVIYLLGTLISAFIFGTANDLPIVLIGGALLSFFNLGAWGTLIAFTPSHYEAQYRGVGVGFTQSIGRIGATLGPFLIGALLGMGLSIPMVFMMFVVVLAVGILVLLFGIHDTVGE
ncbi:MFS transporter [Companilactobacillus keshanensis]|uniref:MFS transporter n=1 Tax=Companilactobacillus keshanensis TaxID=2486003 RepID=A0ABW4BY01_9LACO|nr:MFS transporter [Companilactobacillus keshanensis]